MSDTSYFDAYMRGERSRDYIRKRKWDDFVIRWRKLSSFDFPITIPPNTTIRGQGFRPTYMRNS